MFTKYIAPIVKGDRFNLNQCSKNNLEREQMKNISYASIVGSIMYTHFCTRPDIAYAIGMLGRYQIGEMLHKINTHAYVIRKLRQKLNIYHALLM